MKLTANTLRVRRSSAQLTANTPGLPLQAWVGGESEIASKLLDISVASEMHSLLQIPAILPQRVF